MTLFKRLLPFLSVFLLVQTFIRLSLLARTLVEIEYSISEYAQILLRGLWFDGITASFVLIPIALFYLLLPKSLDGKKAEVGLRFVFAYSVLFGAVAEHLFWTEFSTRFNFIAVDYLVYTQEVIGNIVESYPLGWLLAGIGVVAVVVTYLSIKVFPLIAQSDKPAFGKRFVQFLGMIAVSAGCYGVSSVEQSQFNENNTAAELASNGTYNLFSAFWNNEIDYDKFYAMQPKKQVKAMLRQLQERPNSNMLNANTRVISSPNPERHLNVMLVVMESLSAEYMASFGNTRNITPNLDKLAGEGLFFTDLYATGTRTVRGLEAVSLSIPPTPGQSIVRRPDNHDLFSLGFVFKDRGYDTRFIYGGFGYFDNMNAFFAGNGFDVVDRTQVAKENIQFANVWGICDEDLFAESMRKADESFAAGKPFLNFMMTTSNHRPYTYPEGRIDIPSKGGREGGVKYADYSVGWFIEQAKKKPWFKDTIFVFVADHTAGAGGKTDFNQPRYHIPMIFYAPEMIQPQRYEKMASQIDLAPTLLGLLDFTYVSKFYGHDLLYEQAEASHAFISTYQKVSLIKDGRLTVLAPKKEIKQFTWPEVTLVPEVNQTLVDETIGYYQSASWWRKNYLRVPTVVEEKAKP